MASVWFVVYCITISIAMIKSLGMTLEADPNTWLDCNCCIGLWAGNNLAL